MAETQSQSFRVAEDPTPGDYADTAGQASTSGRGDVELLRQAVMNEKAAPELLAFETDLIGRIEAMIDYQVRAPRSGQRRAQCGRCVPHRGSRPGAANTLGSRRGGRRGRAPVSAARAPIADALACAASAPRPSLQEEQIELLQDNAAMEELCLMWTVELSRIRYYLRDYLRLRLGKIEKYCMALLDNPGGSAASAWGPGRG